MEKLSMDELVQNIEQWAADKGINKKENSQAQMCKVMEEVGETASALLKQDGEKLIDGIGDSFVTLIILANQQGFTASDCLQIAWDVIKNRKGKTENGVFIKES